MPSRLTRYQKDGHCHAINFTCYCQQPWLEDHHACTLFEETLEELRRRHDFYLFGYVIMPTHVHLLMSEPKQQTLATAISVLKAETSKHLKGDRKQFWQIRYYDFNVFTHPKFTEKLRYIHRNPVADGLVERPEDWPWSSFRHYLTGDPGRVEIESQWTWNRREQPNPTHRDKTTMNGAPRMKHPHQT